MVSNLKESNKHKKPFCFESVDRSVIYSPVSRLADMCTLLLSVGIKCGHGYSIALASTSRVGTQRHLLGHYERVTSSLTVI